MGDEESDHVDDCAGTCVCLSGQCRNGELLASLVFDPVFEVFWLRINVHSVSGGSHSLVLQAASTCIESHECWWLFERSRSTSI